MKKSLILISLFGFLILFTEGCAKTDYLSDENYDEMRIIIFDCILTIDGQVYAYKRINGNFPVLSNEDFEHIIINQEGRTCLCPYEPIKEFDYVSDGKSYEVKIIADYKVNGKEKYTVVRSDNGRIYWKDDFADEEDHIDDLDWGKVDHLVCNLEREEKYRFLKKIFPSLFRKPCNLPNFIP